MKRLFIILGVLGCSLSAVFVRWTSMPSLVLVFYRMLFSAAILTPMLFIRCRKELFSMSLKHVLLSVISGAFLGLHFLCYFASLRLTSISASVVLVDTEVFFVTIAGAVLFKQKVNRLGWCCIVMAFLGSIIICLGDGLGTGAFAGNLVALAGAAAMAVYTMIGSRVRQSCSTTVYTALVYAAGCLTVLIVLLISGVPLTGYQPTGYMSALGMAVFCTLLGHSVFSWGLKWFRPSFISMAKLLEPVFASVLGIVLFAEMPGWNEYLGGAIVVAGLVLYIRNDTR